MKYEVDICQLTPAFYEAYPASLYPEILTKETRPYTCLLIETREGYFICIPFRSSIRHRNAFIFENTDRSARTRSGLDYQKTLLIANSDYITSNDTVLVDNDEYSAMMKNIDTIISGIHTYISKYTDHVTGTKTLHPREYERRYQYSTLPYFHDILGIE